MDCFAALAMTKFHAISLAPETIVTRHSFFCIDGHTCGNPVRLVAGGGPQLDGATMIEKARISWPNSTGSAPD